MSIIAKYDEVKISFAGKLDSGEVFMDVPPENPITITLGNSELPPTVENAVIGMKKGESKEIRVSPDEGYGHRTKDLLHEVPKKVFGDKIAPKPGMIVSQKIEKDGKQHEVPATVIEVKDQHVVIDYNHPLAGHHLTYSLTVLDVHKKK